MGKHRGKASTKYQAVERRGLNYALNLPTAKHGCRSILSDGSA